MAFSHGKDSAFSFNSVVLTTFVDNIEFSNSVDMAETSTMGNETKTYISGLSDSTVSISGKYDPTDVTGPDDVIFDLVGSETASAIVFTPVTGETYTGSAFVTSYAVSAPVGDVVAFSADFQLTGAVVRG